MPSEENGVQQNRLKALERIFATVPKKITQSSAQLVIYFAAAATIYTIAQGDITAVATISPILGRLLESMGGNILASVLDRVALDESDTLTIDDIENILKKELSQIELGEALSEREFYHVISRLRKREEQEFHSLSQGILHILDSLRRLHPTDPAPLSPIPPSARPLLVTSPLIGREADLQWLRETNGDLLLVGQPGIGKTFLLHQLAIEDGGLFVLSKNRGEIAAALREDQPSIVIVDNAHSEIDVLLNLRQLRQELGIEFDILASSWPGAKDTVAEALHLNKSRIHELATLNPDQIVEVIKIAGGSHWPNSLIREIREQANGRPGLAVTLTYIYLDGGGTDVWKGDILRQSILNFEPLDKHLASIILGAFSLGGEAGMPHKAISEELGESTLNLSRQIANLTAAGIVFELDKQHLSVQPPALRYAVVRDVFFKSKIEWWDIRKFLQHVPSDEEAAITLVNVQARGATIPQELMIEQLERANSIAAWMRYAALGVGQKKWVLEHYPEKIVHRSSTSLRLVPERVVPLMLIASVGDRRPLGPNPSHPMRLIRDWVQSAFPGTGQAIERRKLLLEEIQLWVKNNQDNYVGACGLQIAMSPKYHAGEPDPGAGNSYILNFGLVAIEDLQAICDLWPSAHLVLKAIHINHWHPIREMINEWAYPDMASGNLEIASDIIKLMHSFAAKMLRDYVQLTKEHAGILHWSIQVAKHLEVDFEIPVDEEFMVIYPIIRQADDYEEVLHQSQLRTLKIAEKWSKLPPLQVAKRISYIETEAQNADINWPRLTPYLCQMLAERVENPVVWFQAFQSANLSPDLIGLMRKKYFRSLQD